MKKYAWLFIGALFFLPALCSGQPPAKESSEGIFFRANQAYKDGQFKRALEGYLHLIEKGHKNGRLYYNIGNTYYRIEDLGKAILFYERALLLIPRDPDLKFNLAYALDQTTDIIDEPESLISQSFFWLDDSNMREVFYFFMFVNILFFGILVIRLFSRADWTYYLFILLVIFLFIASSSLALKYYQLKWDDRAVILAKEVPVLAGPDPNDIVLFKLHEGAVIHHERSEDVWSLIHLSSEKRGWVRSKTIERIVNF